MIISHCSKFIFIHIQRTGGSSIINLLLKHLGDGVKIVSQHGNARSDEIKLLEEYNDYFTFAFVRNPWERILSWYLLINRENHSEIEEEKKKFENFIDQNLAFKPDDLDFFYNQLDYISDINGNLLTDKIYRYENYKQEILVLQNDLKLPQLEVQKMNPTLKINYQDYYTDKSQKMIFEKCKKDIEYFNYSF